MRPGMPTSTALAPQIVEGAGRNLPGLLGLRTLERERAILDCGQKMLLLIGEGDTKLELPPGSTSIPLHKAPQRTSRDED